MAEPERATRGNVFTNKLGPLPMWAWVAIAGAGIVVWAYLKNRSASASSTSGGASSVPASDVPQFVNQTYTTVTAPQVEQPPSQTSTQTGTIPMGPGEGGPEPKPFIPGPPGGGSFHPPKPKVHLPRPGGGGGQPIFNATYVVRPGDTLNSVAKRYHVTREELAHANGYGTGAGLRTGERLKVPSPAGTGTPNRAP